MKKYKIIDNLVTNELFVNENSQFNYLKANKVVVAENVTVRIFGIINKLLLHKNSIVYIHGSITGDILNQGGEIHLFVNNDSK